MASSRGKESGGVEPSLASGGTGLIVAFAAGFLAAGVIRLRRNRVEQMLLGGFIQAGFKARQPSGYPALAERPMTAYMTFRTTRAGV